MKNPTSKTALLVIGGSAGSLTVVLEIIKLLTMTSPPVILVTHRKSTDDETLLEVLRTRTSMKVKEADEKEIITRGTIYVAPPDYHLLIEKDFSFTLDDSEKVNYSRPSIDATFETAAQAYGDRAVCLLLSGANADGVNGLKVARHFGTKVVIQDPATAEVPFMPQSAIEAITPDLILKAGYAAQFIAEL